MRVSTTRRAFLKTAMWNTAAWTAAGGSLASPFEALAHGPRRRGRRPSPDYGPLEPVDDATTGLPLLRLPRGFRYLSMSWTGEPMRDGAPTPGFHDGGAALRGRRGRIHYVRNHEQSFPFRAATPGSFAPPERSYDAGAAPGGTTTVVFDPRAGRHLGTYPSLGGTLRNCAGGPTPWNSWLSCEETLAGPGPLGLGLTLEEPHGWVFEVPARRRAHPEPLRAMGRFFHEAVAVEPWSGVVYQTEDRFNSGIYRFVPRRWGRLRWGGRLQMLRIPALPGFVTGTGLAAGSTFDVDWVDIADPETNVFLQGLAQGGAIFRRGEGMWYGRGRIFFTSTNGGAAGSGQVWMLSPWTNRLTLLFESPGAEVLDHPDNLAVSPRGGILLCEDGGGAPEFLRGLTRRGELFDFAQNDLVLDRAVGSAPPGDYRSSEFAGASFSPDGRWLFVNIQVPGVTLAITGPWRRGAL